MNNIYSNPFILTKASEYQDQQIADYWVNIWQSNNSFRSLLDTGDNKAKYILGSKGFGKTHLMRYYSFPLQKIKYQNNYKKILTEDIYIGIFLNFSALNSSRFVGKGIEADVWLEIFKYYFELFLVQNMLVTLKEFIEPLKVPIKNINKTIELILDVFDSKLDIHISTFDELVDFFKSLQKNIDYEINNTVFTRHFDNSKIDIKFSSGKLIFEIPKIITAELKEFKEVTFLFLLDELEKLFDTQKQFINTLVWEKQNPVNFWIGSRLYGFRERKTITGEYIKEGSEYEAIHMDYLLRKDEKKFKNFANEMCYKRLYHFKFINKSKKVDFSNFFEELDEDEILEIIKIKSQKLRFPYRIKLHTKLIKGFESGTLRGVESKAAINTIISNLQYPKNPLYEKINHLLFYQDWFKNKNLLKSSLEIKDLFHEFIQEEKSQRHRNIIDKFKKDLIAQLLIEVNEYSYNIGFNTFVDMSWGNPRFLLTILNHVYQNSINVGDTPFIKGKISSRSQNLGVMEAANWFYNEIESDFNEGINYLIIIQKIAEIFRAIRFSDKPTECSVVAFYIQKNKIQSSILNIINNAEDRSIIVKIEKGRKDKNTQIIEDLFQLNKMLTPLWNLPLSRRGTINLSKDLLTSIFMSKSIDEFEKNLKEFKSHMNAPFWGKPKLSVFENKFSEKLDFR